MIAARKLGIEQLPVLYADDLSPADRHAMSLALNRLYELGEFDQAMLGALVMDLEVELPGLEFDELGFEAAEIDRAVAAHTRGSSRDEQTLPPIPSIVSNRGDVWLLDDHRVGCGDAADAEIYARLLEGRSANMVFTDPPYGCPVQGFVTTRAHREFVQASGDLDPEQLERFFRTWCEVMAVSAEPGAVIELCIDWRSASLLMSVAQDVFGPMINMAVWVKDRAGMGSFLRSQHELVLIFAAPGRKFRNNVELGKNGRHRSNVWRYPSALTFARTGVEGDLLEDHPTPKPKELIMDAILDCTSRGDTVLDPFLGSGSTLVAAEITSRKCVGIDLDPGYVDLAVRRWQSWTGRDAVLESSGRTFNDILADDRSGGEHGGRDRG
ncbi:DNA modification methylase [Sphingomonas sediminicola]|uniref:Methyltransferase n=1 Tax=Sphingomonas sediminicola TaxID=386874 RepID=A0ABX6TDC3_9SPHN|nr:DNA modification methylase [Sphingomonas sediminicola]QNP45633.1 DNA modification methylase [Sphingomonas sediminicola]